MIKLVPNARKVALKAFSMWCNYLGILVLVLPEIRFLITGVDTDPTWVWSIGIALIFLGIAGRLIDQRISRE